METKKRFAPETVQQIQMALEGLPPCEASELSKQQAVLALSTQIDDLRVKGYGWTAIAAILSERGLPVSPAALRTYLRRGRTEVASAKARRPTKRSAQVAAPVPVPSNIRPVEMPTRAPATTVGSAPLRVPLREGEGRTRGPVAPKPIPGTTDAVARPTQRESEPRPAFNVRPDTEEI